MPARAERGAFTLMEALMILVIVGVLAGTIIPQVARFQRDSRERALRSDLQSLRAQLEDYKSHHGGALPTGANDLEQLTKATDVLGHTSTTGLPDAEHPFGPYVHGALPAQPFSGQSSVRLDAGAAGTIPTATAGHGGGWIYRPATGEIFIDHADYVNQ